MERGTTRFRKLLANKEIIVAPGAMDAFSALIIQSLEFPAVYMGGNAAGSHLGVGEPFLTLTETVECAQRILAAIDVPLVVDGGAGFGDPVHTYRSVRTFERAGIAAIHIEDQVYPKRAHYHRTTDRVIGQAHVIPLDHMLDKLKAALDARQDPDFVLIGRTDALPALGSLDEAIERCHAYREVGVDMLLVTGPPTPEQARIVREAIKDTPLMWISGVGARELSVSEIAAMGYQLLVYSSSAPVIVADALIRAFSHVRDHGTLGWDVDKILELRQKVKEITGMPKYWEIEARTTERT